MPLGKKKRVIIILLFFVFYCTFLYSENIDMKSSSNDLSQQIDTSFDIEEFINNILESYSNSCVNGTRIMMETGESARYRYEFIMRKGHDKLVSLKMPYRVTWYRVHDNGYIIMDGKKIMMEDKMKDLEDVFLEDIQKEIKDIKLTEIQYSGIPAFYILLYQENWTYRVILLQESMQFIRLEKETESKLTVMLYDNLNQGNKDDFTNQISWYQDIPEESADNLNSSDDTQDNTLKDVTILSDFEELLKPLLENYAIQKTEMIEFTDARAMFLTMTDRQQQSSPFVIVIIIHDNIVNTSNSESILGKIPENYNMCQKIIENIEINVIGSQEKEYLEEISTLIIQTKEK